MLLLIALAVLLLWMYVEGGRRERARARRLATAAWQRQEMDRHPWERDEPWAGMEQPHRPTWTRRLRLAAKDTWAKEQPKRVFKFRR